MSPVAPRRAPRRHDLAAAAVVLLAVPVMVLVLWGRDTSDQAEVDIHLLTEAAAGETTAPADHPPAPGRRGGSSDEGASTGATPGLAPPPEMPRPEMPPPGRAEPAASGGRAAAAPAPAAPRPVEGRLVVVSEPAGAMVTVNGIGHGRTPVTVRYLPMGEQRIRLTLPGYRSEERVVRLGADAPSRTTRVVLRRGQ